MLELLALVLTVDGWTGMSTTMAVSETDGVARISGTGSCYVDLTDQALPSQIKGLSFMVKGKGTARARLMMDTEGTTLAVVAEFTAGETGTKISLSREDAKPISLRPIVENMPERMRLYVDADEPVDLQIWEVETW
jgi:hypothetical protein